MRLRIHRTHNRYDCTLYGYETQVYPKQWRVSWRYAGANAPPTNCRVPPPDSWRDRRCVPAPAPPEECRSSSDHSDYSAPLNVDETRRGRCDPLRDRIAERSARTKLRALESPDAPVPAFRGAAKPFRRAAANRLPAIFR